MCASYNPPIEDITEFNTSLFNQPEDTLSQAEADRLYLSKTKNDISTASSTTFNGNVNVGGMLNLTSGASIGEIVQSGGNLEVKNNTPQGLINFTVQNAGGAINNVLSLSNTGTQTGVIVNGNTPLYTKIIKSTAPTSTGHTLFDNMTSPGTLTIGGTSSTNNIRGNTTFPQNVTIGTDGVSTDFSVNANTDFGSNVSIKNKLKLSQMTNIDIDPSAFIALDFPLTEVNVIRAAGLTAATIQLPAVTLNEAGLMFSFFKFQTNLAITLTSTSKFYTLNNFGTGFTSNTSLLAVDKTMTTLMCGFYGGTERYWVEVSNYSTFDRDYNNSIYPRLLLENSFSNRLRFSGASYSFPFASSQSLGYYLKSTGTSQTVISGTPKTILTTPTVPIGVWRIDFSVQLTVGATGAGTITQSQSYLSTTSNGAVATAVPFTGSILRSHTSEVYANNDIQVITSNITYNQSTAGVLYLNILRTFGTGTYSFIGEVGLTRIA